MLIPSGSRSDGLGLALSNEGFNRILKVINLLMLILSGSGSSSSSDGLCVFSSPSSFLRSLRCFSKGTIPQFIDGEDGWREFNESMHDRYGYNKLPDFPRKMVTKEDLNILVDFYYQLDERCQWMTKIWILLLAPLVKSEDNCMRLPSALTVSWLMSMISFFFIYKFDTSTYIHRSSNCKFFFYN